MKRLLIVLIILTSTTGLFAQNTTQHQDTLDMLTSAIWEMVPDENMVMACDTYLAFGPNAYSNFMVWKGSKTSTTINYNYYLSDKKDLLFDPSKIGKVQNGKYLIVLSELAESAVPVVYTIKTLTPDSFVFQQGEGMILTCKKAVGTDKLIDYAAKEFGVSLK